MPLLDFFGGGAIERNASALARGRSDVREASSAGTARTGRLLPVRSFSETGRSDVVFIGGRPGSEPIRTDLAIADAELGSRAPVREAEGVRSSEVAFGGG